MNCVHTVFVFKGCDLNDNVNFLSLFINMQFVYNYFISCHFFYIFLFSYLYSWERASIFPFECSVLNKGTIGTIFITSLVWRGPWLGIEPGISRTVGQHSTTRLSRRRCSCQVTHSSCFLLYYAPTKWRHIWLPLYVRPEDCFRSKWTTGTIFITSLVWRGPWLGIEPGISRTGSQHSTTRLSRRRYWI